MDTDTKFVNAENVEVDSITSVFVTGQTGSGKSELAIAIMKKLMSKYSSDELKLAIFDLKKVEFQDWTKERPQYLLFGVVSESDLGLERLEYVARIVDMRLRMKEDMPRIFVYVEECDMAVLDQKRFDDALIKIADNAKQTNIQVIYSTSRAEPNTISNNLINHFDNILCGATSYPIEYLGITKPVELPKFSFISLR